MNFASKYVWDYDRSDEECVSDEEYEHGMTLSDSEDEDETAQRISSKSLPTKKAATKPSITKRLKDRLFGGIGGGSGSSQGGEPSSGSRPNRLEKQEASYLTIESPPPEPQARNLSTDGDMHDMLSEPCDDYYTPLEAGSSQSLAAVSSQSLAAVSSQSLAAVSSQSLGAGARSASSRPKSHRKKKRSHWRSQDQTSNTDAAYARKYRRADTNVMVVNFEQLSLPSNMHAGDAVVCAQCQAILSHVSKLTATDSHQKVWLCEFCSCENAVDIEAEEVPTNQDVTFMLQPAPSTAAASHTGVDQSLVIFCVDVSGSMCVTTEVEGRIRLRGAERLDSLQAMNEERESQWLPGQRRNMTYISRLQGVQAAVDHQLAAMVTEHPDRRVGLVSFNNEVCVVGDGSAPAVVLAGDKLNDQNALLSQAKDLPKPKSIKESRNVLGDKVFDLEERGATALGPALLLSVAIAAEVPGSKVIVCTDGMANVGLGSLEGTDKNEEELKKATDFYGEVSSLAQQHGVSVSVISIQGSDCRLVELGRVADETGGQVNIVDPLKLTQEFGSILATPVIATNVTATFIVHKRMYIRDEDSKESRYERYVGNVTKETEISYEYGMRPTPKTEPDAALNLSEITKPDAALNLSEIPFQMQIKYTDLEGAQALRLITHTMPVTKDRQTAEKEIDVGVLGVHTAQTSAKLAINGKYSKSRMTALMQQRLISRASKTSHDRTAYKRFYENVSSMENNLAEAQVLEDRTRGHALNLEEDEVDEVVYQRRQACSDSMAENMYSSKAAKSKSFNPFKK